MYVSRDPALMVLSDGSAHTPGPWSTYLNTRTDVVVRKMFPDWQEAFEIARVKSVKAMFDASLIAAAPELLEALEQAVTSMQDSGYPNSHVAVRAARAAIAKATGGAA